MRKQLTAITIAILVFSTSCEDLLNLTDTDELTTDEVIEGLKTALKVGTDSTVSVVSAVNGYYLDRVIKIPLPEEASVITDNLDNQVFQSLGVSDILQEKVEDVILAVNRSAEEAAKDAGPIFRQSISDLSISDGWAILNGTNPAESTKAEADFDSTAATAYLRSTTYTGLVELYAPVMNQALDQDLGAGFSANDAWNTLTDTYNEGAGSLLGLAAGLETVDTELDEFVVRKALDGLFYKVGRVETEIRRDPLAWAASTVGDLFKKVFGN